MWLPTMSDQEYEKRMEKLTRESVRLQKWQMAISTFLGILALVGTAYLTQSILILLIIGIVISLALVSLATMVTESDESFWMDKVAAANEFREWYAQGRTPNIGRGYRSALETVYGYAIVARRQDIADYFKRLIDEYDSSLSRS
jgi:hypothetical protein